jgi:uncharacterized membrane protein
MTQNGGYDLTPEAPKPEKPKPGEPGWVPPEVVVEKAEEPEKGSGEEEKDPDVEKHKGLALLGYVFFVIPLVAAPNSPFARYHANQGLLVFIVGGISVVAVIVLHFVNFLADRMLVSIPLLGYFFSCIFYLLQVGLLVGTVALAIMGIIHAANGERKSLPVVGHWTLIK